MKRLFCSSKNQATETYPVWWIKYYVKYFLNVDMKHAVKTLKTGPKRYESTLKYNYLVDISLPSHKIVWGIRVITTIKLGTKFLRKQYSNTMGEGGWEGNIGGSNFTYDVLYYLKKNLKWKLQNISGY